MYTNAPRPTKQTAAITPTATPAFFPLVIPPLDDSFDSSALSWLISLATSEFGTGVGDGDSFALPAFPGDGAVGRSDGGGAGGEVRFDEGDGAGVTGGEATSAPDSGAGVGELAGGSVQIHCCTNRTAKRSVKESIPTFVIANKLNLPFPPREREATKEGVC